MLYFTDSAFGFRVHAEPQFGNLRQLFRTLPLFWISQCYHADLTNACSTTVLKKVSLMSNDVLKLDDLSDKDRKALEQFIKEAGSLEAAIDALDALAAEEKKAA